MKYTINFAVVLLLCQPIYAGTRSEVVDFIVYYSLPHTGISRGFSESTPIAVIEATLQSETLSKEFAYTDEQRLMIDGILTSTADSSSEKETQLLEVLNVEQRAIMESLVFSIDGLAAVSRQWWSNKFGISPAQRDAIIQLEKNLNAEKVGQLHSSFFVAKITPERSSEYAIYTLQINIDYGLDVLEILSDESMDLLLEQIDQCKQQNVLRNEVLCYGFRFDRGFPVDQE